MMKSGMEHIVLKEGVSFRDLTKLHPATFLMLAYVNSWCYSKGTVCFITSIHSDRDLIASSSKTHDEFRAFDLGVRPEHGWTIDLIDELLLEVFRHFHAIGAKKLVNDEINSRPWVYGDERHINHIHFQSQRVLRPEDMGDRLCEIFTTA